MGIGKLKKDKETTKKIVNEAAERLAYILIQQIELDKRLKNKREKPKK